MAYRTRFLAAVSVLLHIAPLSALTYTEAEKRMLSESSVIKQQKQAVEIARQDLQLRYSAIYPKGSLNWANARRDAWTQSYSLDIEASLFAGGAEYSAIGALKLRREAAELELRDLEDTQRIRLGRMMLAGALANGKLEVLKRNKKTIDDRVAEQKRRMRLGQVREPDMLQSQMESLRLDRSISDLNQAVLQSAADVRGLIAMTPSEELTFPPIDVLVGELQSSIRPRADFTIAALQKEREALDLDVRTRWRSHLPTLNAYASYGDPGSSSIASREADWTMGLRAQWVFFAGFELPAQVRRAKAQGKIIDEQIQQTQLDRNLSVALRKTELSTFERNLGSVKESKEMARKAVGVQQVDYRRGIVTELEVLSSIQNYLELQTEELDLINQIASTKLAALELGMAL